MTMQYWNLGNRFRPINFKQFKSLGSEFLNVASQHFQTKCSLSIEFMAEAKAYISFVDPIIESEIEQFVNKERQLAILQVRDDVTQDLWEQANHVHIMIRHHSGNAEPPHIAHLEFIVICIKNKTLQDYQW